jgi:type I restriction enzyme R subunit
LRFRSQTEKHELSHIYEAKIRNMGNAGRNGGEYYTPRPLIRAMVRVVQPQIGERIYDGACGSAGFLCEAYEHLKTSTDPNYCQRVNADDGALGEQHLRDFQDNEKSVPTVLTTSQKLSTGVDARNIRNIALMRPINSMIEFKQIIGRGTRLYEGNDYFTLFDFVKAYQHFSDPEWDGEPVEPEPPGLPPADKEPGEVRERHRDPAPKPQRARVKLADGKTRAIQHMMATSFWHPDGTPMSAQQFVETLFGKLPDSFGSEEELRALWRAPDTRKKLLAGRAEQGFGRAQLTEMQQLIEAEKSD